MPMPVLKLILRQTPRNQQALNLAGAFVNLGNARIAVKAMLC